MALVDIGLNCACPQYTHLAGLGRKMGLVDLGLNAIVETGEKEEGEEAGSSQGVEHLRGG